MEKDMERKLEWLEAQKVEISVDLFAAAKEHLQFLEVVDRNQWLYDGPALERAIFRYNAYWLPLLAKYTESSSICEGPLAPPLDCEWVWHCHRLNPVRYKSDCEELYGRVLDNFGVVSSVNGNCKSHAEEIWKRLYPMEPYDLDLDMSLSKPMDISALEKCTTYDLVSAVKRQSPFYKEVSRALVDNDIILQEAVARYKAFLYLIKKNIEKSIKLISVPTYDIDLIWHTHQLNPSSYCKDLEKIVGTILQHDDTDSDQSVGNKVHTGFFGTTAQWEETFGQKYSKDVVETTPIVVVVEKHGAGARCFHVADDGEKHSAGARCFAMEVENYDAAARCFAVAAAKHGVGSRCFAIDDEKNGGRCFALEAEKCKACARCFAVTTKKCGATARCFAVSAKKNNARCFAIDAEKNGARCFAVAPEKNCARCFAIDAEKNGARCFALASEKNSARCFAVDAEKNGARCFAVAPEKNSARCFAIDAKKNGARCFALASEKRDASARCFAVTAEKCAAGRCFAIAPEKNNARCFGVSAEKKNARCFAVAAGKNVGNCGNMMKNNANENAPPKDALNGTVAA